MKPTPFSVLTIKSISILLVLLGQLDSTLIFLLGHNKEVGILDLTSRLRYVQNRARFGVQSIFNAIPTHMSFDLFTQFFNIFLLHNYFIISVIGFNN
jgi:hypothetical protein